MREVKKDKKRHRTIIDVFMKDKHTKTMGVILILAAITIGYLEIDFLIPERVTVVHATMKGTEKTEVMTRAKDVGGLIDELDYKLNENDSVVPAREHEIKDGMSVKTTEVIQAEAKVAGKRQEILLTPGTVKQNLAFNNIEYDDDDEIKPALDKKVNAKTRIEVKEIHYKVKDKTETVQAQKKVTLDPSLASGTISETEGQDGEAVYTYTTKYVNGSKKSTVKELKEWKTEVVDDEIRLGTASTGESGETSIREEFTAETTAYYAGSSARGSTGSICHYGTCAVDPSVIPYGTRLYIEGYGVAVANDCGGAVKGHIVDVYMRSTSACIQWGRRNKRAFILG